MSHAERALLNAMRRAMEMNRQAKAYLDARAKQAEPTVKDLHTPPDFMRDALKDKK